MSEEKHININHVYKFMQENGFHRACTGVVQQPILGNVHAVLGWKQIYFEGHWKIWQWLVDAFIWDSINGESYNGAYSKAYDLNI